MSGQHIGHSSGSPTWPRPNSWGHFLVRAPSPYFTFQGTFRMQVSLRILEGDRLKPVV